MSIKKEYLGRIAENVLKTLDNENVTTSSDLDRIMNQTFLIGENTKEKISVELRPSNLNTTTRVISYITPERGIPLEIRVNEELKYSQIILKGNFNLSGYEAFHQDIFGNIAQNKKLDSTNISQIKSELKKLI
jgi:uncharacterized protein YueI